MRITEQRQQHCSSVVLRVAVFVSLSFGLNAATPQIGGGSCSSSMLTGTYFYLLTGIVASGGQVVSYAELGKLVADGNGGVSGQSFVSQGGQQTTYVLNGTYTAQPNCSGSMTLSNGQTTGTLAFQIVNGGQGMTVAISTSTAVLVGEADRQTAGTSPIQCGNGSLSGGYGYALTGVAAVSGGNTSYSDAGQIVSDGNGNLTGASLANLGGTVSQVSGNGMYSIGNDCSGRASLASENGSAHYYFALALDGRVALFFGSDAGRTVAGVVTPQFNPASQSVVNGASFRPGMVAPGSLFSVFGTGFASNPTSAQALPLPTTLGTTKVLVNGTPASLVYVSSNQINAQMPIGIPTGQPVSITVTNASAASNNVTVMIPPVAPGLFTSNDNQAIIQNQNGSLNSTAAPAHPGDVVVAYLTGGGAVNTAGSWISGAASPGGASSVTAPYSLTVGGQPAQVEYIGLTPGFVGLYQSNFTVPTLAPGAYPVVVTIGGAASNAAMVDVGG